MRNEQLAELIAACLVVQEATKNAQAACARALAVLSEPFPRVIEDHEG
jgi:hypothetical protein